MKRIVGWTALAAVAACAPGTPPPAEPGPAATAEATAVEAAKAAPAAHAGTQVPAGYGTLRQDEFTMALRDGPLLIKVTPLAERVIRLAAPDTYERLHALAESRRADAAQRSGVGEPELFLVSLFSYEPDVPYQPENLELGHQGRVLRPRAILPLTPGWGRQRLQQQETQAAIYSFEGAIDYEQSIRVRWGLVDNDDWDGILRRLEVERAKVRARAGGE